MSSPNRLARMAGLFYLLVAIFALLAHATKLSVHVPGDATATTGNVVANSALFRIGSIADLVQATCMLFTGMALYLLLRHIHENIARVMMIFVVILVAVVLPTAVYRFAALLVATDTSYADAFGAGGPDAVVLLLLDMHGYGVLAAQILFGLWLLPLGYLVYRSGTFPRVLGALLMSFGCFGYLVDLLARLAAPDFGAALSPFVVTPSGLVEIVLLGWLLIKGVGAARPKERVALAA